jgi:hypothetical protein
MTPGDRSIHFVQRSLRLAAAVGVAALVAACQVMSLGGEVRESGFQPSDNPVTVDNVTKNDKLAELAKGQHPRILATYGGEYSDAKLERMVAKVVGNLTLVSGNPAQTYRITILNSPNVNAFALPGGYLYVTRGLLALANDSAELAAVIAHEMGHVTANHGLQRQQLEAEEELATKVVSDVLGESPSAKAALIRGKLRLAQFSRNQELEADAIGIKKGKPFAPDARMKAILTEAVAVGNATARTIVYAPRDPRQKFFKDRQWNTGFLGGYAFFDNGERILDGRTLFLYYATGITPAMAPSKPGVGSAYAYTARDATGHYLDGGKTYKVTLPGPVPAARFWSFTVYDNQTRSMLDTPQRYPRAGSQSYPSPAAEPDADGSTTVYFGPSQPDGVKRGNWVQTMPGKGWFTILRFYSPLQPFFDKSWRPSEIELAK